MLFCLDIGQEGGIAGDLWQSLTVGAISSSRKLSNSLVLRRRMFRSNCARLFVSPPRGRLGVPSSIHEPYSGVHWQPSDRRGCWSSLGCNVGVISNNRHIIRISAIITAVSTLTAPSTSTSRGQHHRRRKPHKYYRSNNNINNPRDEKHGHEQGQVQGQEHGPQRQQE